MKDDLLYVSHILTAIADIREFTSGMKKKDFLDDKMAEHAVVRNIEVIGEASKNLSHKFRATHTDIPWKDIIRMRNKIVHFYFGIDYGIVWEVVRRELPRLEKRLERIMGESSKG